MKVLVALKRVADPDNANKVKVSASGDAIDTTGLEWKTNPFDEYALEAALRLTENGKTPKKREGEVVVVTLGPKESETMLRAALATGADRAIRVEANDADLDGRLVALALKTIVETEKPDLILLGKQAVDGDSNQVGQRLAELLDYPMATFAATIHEEAGSVLVSREVDGGVSTLRVKLPAVVTVDLRIVAPTSVISKLTAAEAGFKHGDGVRFAPLPAIMAAKKKPLDVKPLAELVSGATLATKYVKFERPAQRAGGAKVKDVTELVEKLATVSKVISEAMSDALVIAELSEDGKVKKSTLSAITFAQRALPALGGSFSILVLGPSTKAAAAELAGYGAAKVLTCDDAAFAHYTAEQFTPTVAAVGKAFGLIVATATSFGKDLLPRVAARLDAAYAGDCSGVAAEGGKLVYKRPMFAGNAFGYCTLSTPIQVATARQSEFAAAAASGGASPMESVAKTAPSAAAGRVEFVSLEAVKSARPELTEASVVVSGGRALKEKFMAVLEPLADALGAALGASRAAVDAGYAPGDFQVGQTGKIVAPKLYVAVGISGAIQHIAGMKGSKVIVAINKDPEAPIFQLADYGLVADLFVAVPALVTELKKRA